MFDLGWSEMGIVLLIALLVLGPKELPKLARDLGRWVGKARSLSREFQRALEDMARETELDDMKKQLEEANRELKRPQIGKRVEQAIDPTGELKSSFEVDAPARPADKPGAVEAAEGRRDDRRDAPSVPEPASPER